jgi:RNA polymerase sigma-B factor
VSVPYVATTRQWVTSASVHPLVDADLWAKHVSYARRRDKAAFDALVDEYRPFAISAAKRHFRQGEPLDDLIQVALEALIRALNRFEPERGVPFLAFAKPTVVGTLRRHYRDAGWAIRVPRKVHELAAPMREATDWLCQDLGRQPSAAEVADFLGVAEDEILAAQMASEARATASVDAPDQGGAGRGDAALAITDRRLATAENRAALEQCLDTLSDDDRWLVRRYYLDGSTQSEIAAELGCSQMQVSRLLARVVKQLRSELVES